MRIRRPSGFSLVEALLSMVILAIVLGAAGSLFLNYARVTRHSSPKERCLVEGQVALERMRSEVSAAAAVYEPDPSNPGALYTHLIFNKLDPSLNRLPQPLNFALAFEPQDPAQMCQVEYSVTSGQLWRLVFGGAYSSRELMMDGVVGQATQFVGNAGVNITINVQEENSQRVMGSFSTVWIRP